MRLNINKIPYPNNTKEYIDARPDQIPILAFAVFETDDFIEDSI